MMNEPPARLHISDQPPLIRQFLGPAILVRRQRTADQSQARQDFLPVVKYALEVIWETGALRRFGRSTSRPHFLKPGLEQLPQLRSQTLKNQVPFQAFSIQDGNDGNLPRSAGQWRSQRELPG